MATHSNILAWKIPWTEEPGGLQSVEMQRVGPDRAHVHTLLTVCCIQMRESCSVVPTLCNSTHYSPPGSSVHGILQARILEWVAICLSRGSSQPRD